MMLATKRNNVFSDVCHNVHFRLPENIRMMMMMKREKKGNSVLSKKVNRNLYVKSTIIDINSS